MILKNFKNSNLRAFVMFLSMAVLLHAQFMVGHSSSIISNNLSKSANTIIICTGLGFEEITLDSSDGETPKIPFSLDKNTKCPFCSSFQVFATANMVDAAMFDAPAHILLRISGNIIDFLPISPHIGHIPPSRAPPYFVFS